MTEDLMKITTGRITNDPTDEMSIGSRFIIQPRLISPTAFSETSASLDNWDFFEGMLLMLSFADHDWYYTEGSAVMVGPGMALCAKHVLEPRFKELMAADANAMCKGITPHGVLIWNIRKITIVPNSDFVILGLELASALPPNDILIQAAITTRTPRVGEELLICGFRASKPMFPRLEQEKIELEGEVRLSKGQVTQVFETQRDSSMLPWPSFEVSCPSFGGMSGGPVFDESGHVIGLLSSSLDGVGVSYVSHIWPVLTPKAEFVWPKGLFKEPIALIDVDHRLCAIDKREALKRIPHESDSGFRTTYKPWQ